MGPCSGQHRAAGRVCVSRLEGLIGIRPVLGGGGSRLCRNKGRLGTGEGVSSLTFNERQRKKKRRSVQIVHFLKSRSTFPEIDSSLGRGRTEDRHCVWSIRQPGGVEWRKIVQISAKTISQKDEICGPVE